MCLAMCLKNKNFRVNVFIRKKVYISTDGVVIQDEEGLKSVAEPLEPICIAQYA